jgi:hypothetical protein
VHTDSFESDPGCIGASDEDMKADTITDSLISTSAINSGAVRSVPIAIDTFLISGYSGCVNFLGGIYSIQKNLFSIKPNPSSGLVYLTGAVNGTYEIYDQLGRIIFRIETEGRENVIDLKGNPPGIYYCRLITASGEIATARLVLK